MGLETTPLPLPPPSATFKTKIPDINLTKGNLNTMEIDDEYGMEDLAAEIAAISWDSEDECEFQGFCRSAHAARNIEEEGKEGEKKDSPLYRMEVLTSDVDTLMSSPPKSLDTFLPSEDEDDHEDDHEDTPITRKITGCWPVCILSLQLITMAFLLTLDYKFLFFYFIFILPFVPQANTMKQVSNSGKIQWTKNSIPVQKSQAQYLHCLSPTHPLSAITSILK